MEVPDFTWHYQKYAGPETFVVTLVSSFRAVFININTTTTRQGFWMPSLFWIAHMPKNFNISKKITIFYGHYEKIVFLVITRLVQHFQQKDDFV